MAETTPFVADALYPGGEGGCRIVFEDPYPGGVPPEGPPNAGAWYPDYYKVSFTDSTPTTAGQLLDMIWNMKSWNVEFQTAIGSSFDRVGLHATGQFTGLTASHFFLWGDGVTNLYYGYSLSSCTKQPIDRVCGAKDYRIKEELIEGIDPPMADSDVTGRQNVASTLPSVALSTVRLDGGGDRIMTGSVDDVEGAESGNFTFTGAASTGGSSGSDAYFIPDIIWIKGDGTVDLFFFAGVNLWYGEDVLWTGQYHEDFFWIQSTEETEYNLAYGTMEMDIFGIKIPAYITGLYAGTDPGDVEYSMKVTVDELWTYPS